MLLTDVARFHANDSDPLVAASFTCPFCLALPASAVLWAEEPDGSAVECTCEPCAARWVVALDDGQTLRLTLAPPEHLPLA